MLVPIKNIVHNTMAINFICLSLSLFTIFFKVVNSTSPTITPIIITIGSNEYCILYISNTER